MLMQADRPQWTFPESTSRPLLSVVMPVRNAMPYLDQAVQSILDQTYRNFEFVVVDDGSTDGSWERLQHLAESDDRIRLFRNPHPAGPVSSSNYAVAMSSRELVARMRAVMRRQGALVPAVEETSERVLNVGDLALDPDEHRVTLAGEPLALPLRSEEHTSELQSH